MIDINTGNIISQSIFFPVYNDNTIDVEVLRLDTLHPVISGNKWFKLQFYLEEALQTGKKSILTFGGPWSNHIIAVAAACKQAGLSSTGIIRGERPAHLSATLVAALDLDMKLFFISREDYQLKKIPAEAITGEPYIIHEGGYGKKGAEGAATILHFCEKENYTHICCAVGTGTMLAGLINGSSSSQQLTGISILKNNYQAEENLSPLLIPGQKKFRILHDYHFGGYAKRDSLLIRFMNDFYEETGIPSDFVYTGKLFFAVRDLAIQGYFPKGSRLLIIHSGGLQGNASLDKGTLIF